jgi:hypothetical protein
LNFGQIEVVKEEREAGMMAHQSFPIEAEREEREAGTAHQSPRVEVERPSRCRVAFPGLIEQGY